MKSATNNKGKVSNSLFLDVIDATGLKMDHIGILLDHLQDVIEDVQSMPTNEAVSQRLNQLLDTKLFIDSEVGELLDKLEQATVKSQEGN
ncbi:hypothetical protein [Convivina intestini]|uniref:Uncharacterized protein n=1 Tax=Convivina intestini TaxID=1505726 RepID=A0A2U1D669_9LACO|nr:hypothetical protein [Convivina intestini]PVY83089.1 hypothetical protein C7384_10937 [Convivina intestini]CAH1856606.1 hypothetical protein R077811_01290 [Convivina intestini]SDB98039.1 hypothetical protein SAMN05216341_10839 [Leuconostocaceae bacterium R-53105]